MLGLRFCARAFSSCGKGGPLFIAVRGPLTIAASLVAEHGLQTLRLSRCGSRAQLLRGMWDLRRPGLEPVYPALAGRFSTTVPPGKPQVWFFKVFSQYPLAWDNLEYDEERRQMSVPPRHFLVIRSQMQPQPSQSTWLSSLVVETVTNEWVKRVHTKKIKGNKNQIM